jgi:capsular polysaccharide transport system permease protein
MKIKVNRFRTRPHVLPAPEAAAEPIPTTSAAPVSRAVPPPRSPAPQAGEMLFDNEDDGFGPDPFPTARKDSAAPGISPGIAPAIVARPPAAAVPGPQDVDGIRREGLTGRQLRMARRLAQKHGLPATSDFDAVRLLRKAGIDPFQKSTVLELVAGQDVEAQAAAGSRALTTLPGGDGIRLPQTVKPFSPPSTEVRAEDAHIAEVRRIQTDILRRRRRKLAALWSKLAAFVFLPTALAGWYFFVVATPMYTAHSEFVIQQATPQAGAVAGLLSGTSFATSQDSVVVQGYLQSPEAMERLDKDQGFRAHFSAPDIDLIQRLEPDANNSQTYDLYRDYVKISYDPTEGVIKMDVSSADARKSVDFSHALISYAEEQVDNLTRRLRDDQMQSALGSFEDAQVKLNEAQQALVALQQKYKTFSSEIDATMISSQIAALEAQISTERLSLAQMESNPQPNQARMDPVKRRITSLQAQIDELRAKLTEGTAADASVATVQSELVMAQADVTTRQMMLAQATTAVESSRIEANRQTRYLSVAVDPSPPDEASYPKAFENTLVVMLIFAGLYLMISMTVAILREQVTG